MFRRFRRKAEMEARDAKQEAKNSDAVAPIHAAPVSALPDELVLAISGAEVYWRPSRADDEDDAPIVRVVGLGNWAFTDLDSAADRVGRTYPELSHKLCIRAARLISNQIGRRNRGVRQLPPRRDPIDREYDAYMLGKL